MAERIARDVDGYPYFIQKYGEALWDAAEATNVEAITDHLYGETRARVQDALDAEFFDTRYLDAPRADQLTLRVAGSLGASSSRSRISSPRSRAGRQTRRSRA